MLDGKRVYPMLDLFVIVTDFLQKLLNRGARPDLIGDVAVIPFLFSVNELLLYFKTDSADVSAIKPCYCALGVCNMAT